MNEQEKIKKEVGEQVIKDIEKQVQDEVKKISAIKETQGAWIHHYVLIDFGFSGEYFYPNSVFFYGSTGGYLGYKRIDNTSLVSLIPILNCEKVHIVWDTSTHEVVHIYGYQTKL